MTTDCGHLRTRWLDEQQAEDRHSRPIADIRIEFLETIAGERLPHWQREIVERLLGPVETIDGVAVDRMVFLPRCPGRIAPLTSTST